MEFFQKNPIWTAIIAIASAFLTTFPSWWPLFVRDKTIPEFFSDRGTEGMIFKTIAVVFPAVGAIMLAAILFSLITGKKAKEDGGENERAYLEQFIDTKGEFRRLPLATESDLAAQKISNKIVFLSRIPRGPNHIMLIEGKLFEDCVILGPGIIMVQPSVTIQGSKFSIAENDVESILYEVPPINKIGGIGVRSSSFLKCYFYGVGFCGVKNELDLIRKNFEAGKNL